jgi:S1-C subfamily serine protease
LKRLQHLSRLELYGVGLDAKSVAELRAALPNCQFDVRSGGVLGVSRFGLGLCELREIMPGTPAAKAGLQPLDVVSEIDGKPLENYRALISYLSTRTGGDKVKLLVQRGGKKMEVEVTLAAWGDD